MHIRMVAASDDDEVLAMIRAHHKESNYAAIAGPLCPYSIAKGFAAAVHQPDTNPCFIYEDDGVVGGMLHGSVHPNYFSGVPVFECLSFYIRPAFRSYKLMKLFMDTAREWCIERSVSYMEFGNATTMDPRIDTLFTRLGYKQVNHVFVRRL